jgi:hypothetical protein
MTTIQLHPLDCYPNRDPEELYKWFKSTENTEYIAKMVDHVKEGKPWCTFDRQEINPSKQLYLLNKVAKRAFYAANTATFSTLIHLGAEAKTISKLNFAAVAITHPDCAIIAFKNDYRRLIRALNVNTWSHLPDLTIFANMYFYLVDIGENDLLYDTIDQIRLIGTNPRLYPLILAINYEHTSRCTLLTNDAASLEEQRDSYRYQLYFSRSLVWRLLNIRPVRCFSELDIRPVHRFIESE